MWKQLPCLGFSLAGLFVSGPSEKSGVAPG